MASSKLIFFREHRKTYCAGISCACEPHFALAKLRVSAQYLHRSLRFFEALYSLDGRLRRNCGGKMEEDFNPDFPCGEPAVRVRADCAFLVIFLA
jgi:hypothetical protein